MYMAPEQARGEAIDQRADLFSLGSVLYVMCTGRPPFRAPSTLAVLRRVAEDTPRPIREIIPEVPDALCALIARLHAKDPAARCASAEEVVGLLRAQLAALGSFPAASSPPPKPAAADPNFLLIAAGARRSRFFPGGGRLRTAAEVFWFLAAAALVALVIVEAAGMTDIRGFIAHQIAPRGTLVIHCEDPNTFFTITGEDVAFRSEGGFTSLLAREDVEIRSDEGRPIRVYRLKAGSYRLHVRDARTVLMDQRITITPNSHQTIRVPQLVVGGESGEFGEWGDLHDPAAGCHASLHGHQLTIATPWDRPRDLDPTPGANLDAPRVLAAADGDFIARAEVQPFSKPTPRKTQDPFDPAGASRRHGAGLVLWADERNFVRLIRELQANSDEGWSLLRLEIFRDGRRTVQEARSIRSPATYLQFERRGDTLLAVYLEEGAWMSFEPCMISGLPARLSVGPVVINTASDDFTAHFEGRALELNPWPKP